LAVEGLVATAAFVAVAADVAVGMADVVDVIFLEFIYIVLVESLIREREG